MKTAAVNVCSCSCTEGTTTRIAAGQEREGVAEVKQSLFTLRTADLMLERDLEAKRTHTRAICTNYGVAYLRGRVK